VEWFNKVCKQNTRVWNGLTRFVNRMLECGMVLTRFVNRILEYGMV